MELLSYATVIQKQKGSFNTLMKPGAHEYKRCGGKVWRILWSLYRMTGADIQVMPTSSSG